MPASPNDEAFAKYVNQIGNATLEQIEAAKAAQDEYEKKRVLFSLGEILVQQGVLTQAMRENVDKKLQAQQKGGIQQLGNFKLLKKLGEGGMGAVYLAEDVIVKRRVALKVLSKKNATPEFLTRFKQEAKAAAKLKHPNIVSAYTGRDTDVREEIGFHFYTMEYCEGESLEIVLERDTTLAHEKALDIVMQVARGLQYAHESGIVHRDIKPANIYLCTGGVAKILDMGLSKNIVEQSFNTIDGQVLGTPHYISPEQAQGTKTIDGRADIYSLGVTFFHLITGQPPYDADAAATIMLQHITEPIPDACKLSPGTPEDVGHIIRVMMAKDPNARYATCGELLAEIECYKQGAILPSRSVMLAAAAREATKVKAQQDAAFLQQFIRYAKMGGVAMAAIVFLLICNSLVHWFMGPSKWELENKDKIISLRGDGDASLKNADYKQALAKFKMIADMSGNEEPKDVKLRDEISHAKQEIARLTTLLANAEKAKQNHELEALQQEEARQKQKMEALQKAEEARLRQAEELKLQEVKDQEMERLAREKEQAEKVRLQLAQADGEKKHKLALALEAERRSKEDARVATEELKELNKKRAPLRAECAKPIETSLVLLAQMLAKLDTESNYTLFVESIQNNYSHVERTLGKPELKTLIEKFRDDDALAIRKHITAACDMLMKCQADWRDKTERGKQSEFDRASWQGKIDAELEEAKTAFGRWN